MTAMQAPEGESLEQAAHADLAGKLEALRGALRSLGSVIVAFSGGADSALLAWVAHDTLGPVRALAITAVSPSLAGAEEAECRALAEDWGLRWTTVTTDELERPEYVANDGDRCYHCKSALMDVASAVAAGAAGAAGAPVVVLGVNVDDLGDHRPGQSAAAERGARFPLVEAGLTKDDVRSLSRGLGLRTWNKPSAPCLASRLPYGTPVTVGALSSVGDAEAGLRALGFDEVRVRHYGDVARIEVPLGDIDRLLARRQEAIVAVRSAGYRYVTLDLEGLRSGNLNRALGLPSGSPL